MNYSHVDSYDKPEMIFPFFSICLFPVDEFLIKSSPGSGMLVGGMKG